MKTPEDDSRVIAKSTLCRVEDTGDGRINIQLGPVGLRLTKRELASLSGTLQRAVRQVFPRKGSVGTVGGRAMLRLVGPDDVE